MDTTTRRSQDTIDKVTATAAGMAAMADWLADHMADRYVGYHGGTTVTAPANDAAELADLTRILKGGAPLGAVTKAASDAYMDVIRDFGGGVTVTAYLARSEACEYIVTGSETVQVPDPDAPMVTVTRDVGEWLCAPILAGAADGEVTA